MAFPVSPVNNQTATINRVVYQYLSVTNSCTRIAAATSIAAAIR